MPPTWQDSDLQDGYLAFRRWFGETLLVLRVKRSLTQKELAESAHQVQQNVADLELNKRGCYVASALCFAQALKVDPGYLIPLPEEIQSKRDLTTGQIGAALKERMPRRSEAVNTFIRRLKNNRDIMLSTYFKYFIDPLHLKNIPIAALEESS